HARDLRLVLLVDAARLCRLLRLEDLDLARPFRVGDEPHGLDTVFTLLAFGGRLQTLGFGDVQLACLLNQRDLALALSLLASNKSLDIGMPAFFLFGDEGNLARFLLELDSERETHLCLTEFGVLRDERDLAIAIDLLAAEGAANFRRFELLCL